MKHYRDNDWRGRTALTPLNSRTKAAAVTSPIR